MISTGLALCSSLVPAFSRFYCRLNVKENNSVKSFGFPILPSDCADDRPTFVNECSDYLSKVYDGGFRMLSISLDKFYQPPWFLFS